MPRALHRRLDRRADEALIGRTLAGAGVQPRPEDLVVRVLRFGPASGDPPCTLVRVNPLEGSTGGAR
jgi:hypothetical protein